MIKEIIKKLNEKLDKPITLNDNNFKERMIVTIALIATISSYGLSQTKNSSKKDTNDLNDANMLEVASVPEFNDLGNLIFLPDSAFEAETFNFNITNNNDYLEMEEIEEENLNLQIENDITPDLEEVSLPEEESLENTSETPNDEEVVESPVNEPTEEETLNPTEGVPVSTPAAEDEIPNIAIPDTGDYLSLLEKELVVRYKFELADETRWKKVVCTLIGEEGTKYTAMYEATSCLLNRYDSYRYTKRYNNLYGLLITSGEFTAYGGDLYNKYYNKSLDEIRAVPSYEAIIDCLYSETPNHNYTQFRDGGRNGKGVRLSEGGDRYLDPLGNDEYRPMEERIYYQKVAEVLSDENHELHDLFLKIPREDMPSINYFYEMHPELESKPEDVEELPSDLEENTIPSDEINDEAIDEENINLGNEDDLNEMPIDEEIENQEVNPSLEETLGEDLNNGEESEEVLYPVNEPEDGLVKNNQMKRRILVR